MYILYKSYKKISLSHYIYLSTTLIRVGGIVLFAFLILMAASQLGTTHAHKLVEGTLHAASSININDKKGKDILGPGVWILVLIDQSHYVIVKKSDTAPKSPLVKLVNKSDVNVATIQRLN